MKRIIILSIFLLIILLLAATATWWAIAPDPLEALTGNVRPGMTQAEVEKELSKPTFDNTFPEGGIMWNKWVTDRLIVMVDFDRAGKVERILVHRRPLWDRVMELRK